jgi:hypothetical protein
VKYLTSHRATPKILLLLLIAIIPACAFGQELKEIFKKRVLELDTSLASHCDRWKPSVRSGFFSMSAVAKASFGPFKTIDIDKDKAKEISRSKSSDLFWKTITTKEKHEASLTVLYNDTDSIFINLLFETIDATTGRSILGAIVLGSKDKSNTKHIAECKEMVIQLPNDSSLWHFLPSGLYPVEPGNSIDPFGKLVTKTDSCDIVYTRGFSGLKKIMPGYVTGIVFTKENKQLAALQLYNKNYVWLTTQADEKTRTLLGAFMAALLCIHEQ